MLTQEIKGNLAKLLATENLVVEHRKLLPASFDVNNRILTLPKWDRASATASICWWLKSDTLNSWGKIDCPRDYVNIADAIEILMKRRYPGLRKAFFNGYQDA